MKERVIRILDYILVFVLIVSAVFIIIYYMLAKTMDDLRNLPAYFLLVVVAYIGAQLIKQLIHKKRPWYNWLYYLGLIAIVVPLPLFSVESESVFTITRVGAFFLLIPPIIELYLLSKNRKKIAKGVVVEEERKDSGSIES